MSHDDTSEATPQPPIVVIDRTVEFDEQFAKLPKEMQKQIVKKMALFQQDQQYPSLRSHPIHKTAKNSVLEPTISISISMKYRALVTFGTDVNTNTTTYTWYWIGSHADYDKVCGKK